MPAFSQPPIEMVHAKTRRFRFTVKDISTGSAINITGWVQFWFVAKTNITDADVAAVITKTLGSGITVIDAVNGVCEVLINAADTAALADTQRTLWAEIQGRDPASLPWSLWQGVLTLQPNLVVAN